MYIHCPDVGSKQDFRYAIRQACSCTYLRQASAALEALAFGVIADKRNR